MTIGNVVAMDGNNPLRDYCKTKHGGIAALAKTLNVHRTAVSHWISNGAVPPAQVPKVHRLTGIPMESLNPEMFRPAGGVAA